MRKKNRPTPKPLHAPRSVTSVSGAPGNSSCTIYPGLDHPSLKIEWSVQVSTVRTVRAFSRHREKLKTDV